MMNHGEDLSLPSAAVAGMLAVAIAGATAVSCDSGPVPTAKPWGPGMMTRGADAVALVTVTAVHEPRFNTDDGVHPGEPPWGALDRRFMVYRPVVFDVVNLYKTEAIATAWIVSPILGGEFGVSVTGTARTAFPYAEGDVGVVMLGKIEGGLGPPPAVHAHVMALAEDMSGGGEHASAMVVERWYRFEGPDAVMPDGGRMGITELVTAIHDGLDP